MQAFLRGTSELDTTDTHAKVSHTTLDTLLCVRKHVHGTLLPRRHDISKPCCVHCTRDISEHT